MGECICRQDLISFGEQGGEGMPLAGVCTIYMEYMVVHSGPTCATGAPCAIAVESSPGGRTKRRARGRKRGGGVPTMIGDNLVGPREKT